MSLLEFASEGVVTVLKKESVKEASRLMQRRSASSLVVLEDRKPAGILTERDIVRRVVGAGRDPQSTTVGDVMTSPIITVEDDLSLPEALETMRKEGVKHLPITDADGNMCGFFTANNVLYLLGLGLRTMGGVADHERGLVRTA